MLIFLVYKPKKEKRRELKLDPILSIISVIITFVSIIVTIIALFL